MSFTKQDIINELKNIYDPEIPVNIWDLGLIYDVDIKPDNKVKITMTFTSPSCPMMDELFGVIQTVTESIAGIGNVEIEIVWNPPWDISKMSDQARLELDLTEGGW